VSRTLRRTRRGRSRRATASSRRSTLPTFWSGAVGGWRAVLIGGLIGALYSLLLWGGLSWLTSPYWSTLGFPDSNDIASGVAATAHFIRAPWELPLFSVPTFAFESGPGIVVQTNAVPIAALIAKLVYPLVGEINAMGLWQLTTPVLQGAAAAWAAAQMGASRAGVVGAALLATGYGHFTQKVAVHPMLSTHALPIVVLGIAAGVARGRIAPWAGAIVALLIPGLALLSNPYLAAMCLPIAAATAWAAIRAGLPVRRGAAAIVIGALVFVGILVIGGYTRMPYEGGRLFGLWSANVAGLFLPHGGEPPSWEWLPRLTAAPDQQHDSGVWIGIGGWIVVVGALLRLRWVGLRAAVGRHLPIALAIVATLVFSWSQRIYLGTTLIADLPLPEPLIDLFDPFRWSGRFAWVPAYALLIGGVAALSAPFTTARRPKGTHALVALLTTVTVLGAGGLQWWMSYHGEMGTAHLYRDGAPVSIERRTQESLVAGARAVRIFPSYFCGERRYAPGNWDTERLAQESLIYFGIAAGRAGASVDAMQIARGYDRGFGSATSACPDYQGTVSAVNAAIADPGNAVILFGIDAKAIVGRADLAGRCLSLPSYVGCPASGGLPDDEWTRRAGLPIGPHGVPLIDGPIRRGDLRMGALVGFADGWSRWVSTRELWETWRPEGRPDPRLDEAAYPLTTTEPATLRLSWPAASGGFAAIVVAAGAEGATIEGFAPLAAGETTRLLIAGDCREGTCRADLFTPLLLGELELLEVAPSAGK
jgi:hypothetical protein